jgi:hypothetical protein
MSKIHDMIFGHHIPPESGTLAGQEIRTIENFEVTDAPQPHPN